MSNMTPIFDKSIAGKTLSTTDLLRIVWSLEQHIAGCALLDDKRVGADLATFHKSWVTPYLSMMRESLVKTLEKNRNR
jgi:hypothetical protein